MGVAETNLPAIVGYLLIALGLAGVVLPVVPGLSDVRIVRSPRRRPFGLAGTTDATFDGINPSHWWLIARVPG